MMFLTVGASSALGYTRTTWYVREDGGVCGSGNRCTGTTDAADPGSGTDQACACNRVDMVLGSGNNGYTGYPKLVSSSNPFKLVIRDGTYSTGFDDDDPTYPDGGKSAQYEYGFKDITSGIEYTGTLITLANPAVVTVTGTHDIDNGQEIYIDFALNTGGTLHEDLNGSFYTIANKTTSSPFTFELSGVDSSSWTAVTGTFVVMVPSMIVGFNYDSGCATKPEIWGRERVNHIFSMSSDDNIYFGCLKLTDHDSCHESAGSPQCNRDGFPDGDWAKDGVKITQSRNIVLKDVDIIGIASHGVKSGNLNHNERYENVKIVGNLFGWIGDWIGDTLSPSYYLQGNTGLRIFKNFHSWWTGCTITYPGEELTACCGSDTYSLCGGADGWQSTPGDNADIHMLNSSIVGSSSDGLDGIYLQNGKYFISRSLFAGNAGQQVKNLGETYIENSIVVGNCSSSFLGKDWEGSISTNICRAGGHAIGLNVDSKDPPTGVDGTGKQMKLNHVTLVAAEGDYMSYPTDFNATSDICDGTESLDYLNSVLYGAYVFNSGDTTLTNRPDVNYNSNCGAGEMTTSYDYSIVYNVQVSPCPSGNTVCSDPLLTATPDVDSIQNNPTLTASSPAVDPSTTGTITFQYGSNDFNNNPIVNGVRDWGAIELGSDGVTSPYNGYLDYIPVGEIFSFIGDFDFTGSFTLGTQ